MKRKEWESRLKSLELLIQGAVLEFEADTGIKVFEMSIAGSKRDVEITVDT